jgi:hypothetical protein
MIDSLQMALNSNAMMLQIGPVEQGEEEAGQETSISGSEASRSSRFTSSSSPATGTTGDRSPPPPPPTTDYRVRLQTTTTRQMAAQIVAAVSMTFSSTASSR